MSEFLTMLVLIIGFMASTCVLFYPQETNRQKAVKIGCYLGDIQPLSLWLKSFKNIFHKEGKSWNKKQSIKTNCRHFSAL